MFIKSIIKNFLGYNTKILTSNYKIENFSGSLLEFVKRNPCYLEEGYEFGRRRDRRPFYPEIKKIEDGFKLLDKELLNYDIKDYVKKEEMYTVKTGNPIKSKPFPMSKEFILRMLNGKNLFRYPSISGHVNARAHFINYLIREGFKKEKDECYDGLSIDNVVYTCSTTHGYELILNSIMRDEDVVLVTGPNYGLFAAMPERINGKVEVLDLSEKDDFYVNPAELSKRIDDINKSLKKEWIGKLDYVPRVVAFLNMNPHNPLGKVMNNNNIDLLKSIGDICLEKNVFVIDDLIYRDIGYDRENLAVPLASIPKYFNNTISLFGISKSYGLAAIRGGAVVAPIPICNAIKEKIFTTMDSMPVFQVWALAGAFNGTNRRYWQAKRYFKPIIKEYKYRFELLRGLIEGVQAVSDKKSKNRIVNEINRYASNDAYRKVLFSGIKNVKIRENTIPESGFFAIVDFTRALNYKYGDDIVKTEEDLVKHLYKTNGFKCIMGQNMSWPYENEAVSRFNFGIEPHDLIHNVEQLHQALSEEFICIKSI